VLFSRLEFLAKNTFMRGGFSFIISLDLGVLQPDKKRLINILSNKTILNIFPPIVNIIDLKENHRL